MGVLILIGTLGAWWGTRTVALRSYGASEGSLRQQLAVVAASPDFRAVLGTFVVQALATGAMLAGVDYVARYLLGSSQLGTVLFLCFVAPAIVVTPLWERFSRRHGKTVGYAVATVVMGTAALLSLADKTLSATVGMTTHRSLLQQELPRLLDTLRLRLHDPLLKIQILLDESKAQELRPAAPRG